MEFRTTFAIEPSRVKITYSDRVMFIGSCFASNMGSQMAMGHMPVMINPAGAVFNPVSVCNTIETLTSGKEFSLWRTFIFMQAPGLVFIITLIFHQMIPQKFLKR